MTDPQNPGGYPPQQPGPQQPQPGPPPGYPAQPGGPPPPGYPTQPGGPPPGYGAAPQPPKKSRKGLIIGLAVGIPLVLIALVVAAVVLFVGAATGPADATNDFLAALQKGDQAALQAASCSDLVSSGELDVLESQIDELKSTRGTITAYNITSSSFENNAGTASGTVTFSKGVTTDITAALAKEGGKWKVCGIHESGGPDVSDSEP